MLRKLLPMVIAIGVVGNVANADQGLQKVNQSCEQLPCEGGLYCISTIYGKKCSTCDQSRSDTLTREVNEKCKSLDAGWTPASASEYQENLASDGRVRVDAFDIMLSKAKECKGAREYREGQCWNGGDGEHKAAFRVVADSIERISAHKYSMIGARRVFHCSLSTYQSELSTYQSKCSLNFPDMNQKLTIMEKESENNEKVDCSSIDKYGDDSERCYESAKTLFADGFLRTPSKFPEDYSDVYGKSESTMKKARSLVATAKSKNLCK